MRTAEVDYPVDWWASAKTVAVAIVIMLAGAIAIYTVLYRDSESEMPIPSVTLNLGNKEAN